MKRKQMQTSPIEITRFYNLDTTEDEDVIAMKNVFRSVFTDTEDIFFSCTREQTITPVDYLNNLRRYIPDFFAKHGKYSIINKVDSTRFHSCGHLKFNEETLNFIIKLWDYFLFMNFFVPKLSFTWDDFLEKKGFFFQDRHNTEELLLNKYSDLLIIKGGDGEMFDLIRKH